jgi:hypothetical protein
MHRSAKNKELCSAEKIVAIHRHIAFLASWAVWLETIHNISTKSAGIVHY